MFAFLSMFYAVAYWLRAMAIAAAGALGVGVVIGWLIKRAR